MSAIDSGKSMLLENLLQRPGDSPLLHLRDAVYGRGRHTELLQEVMGLANADAEGVRHILFGVSRDAQGELQFAGLGDGALEEIETYAGVVQQYIEPTLRVNPVFNTVHGHLLAVLEITGCLNPPYMIKTDVSQQLRCGDCWVRQGGLFRPAQRADLDRMYRFTARRAPKPASKNQVLVGLGQDPGCTLLRLPLPDSSRPPSSAVAMRMQKEISARQAALSANVEDTSVARLLHARLYGNESPYEAHGLNTLVEGYNAVMDNHRDEDDYYYFETQAVKLNLNVVNTGQEALEDVSVVLALPWAEQFRVADKLYPAPGQTRTVKESELLGYPRVKRYNNRVQVKQLVDRLEPDQTLQLFEQDLRIAVLPKLAGQKVVLHVAVHATGLDKPEEGRLRLVFEKGRP
jgi:hypothetical protein